MRKLFKGLRFASRGIYHTFKSQANFKIHLSVALLIIIAGCIFEISRVEWLFVLLCIGIVLFAELFNTSLEFLTDLISPEMHPLAGKVKDVAAGAVLVSALLAAVCGIIIFLPHLLDFFRCHACKN